MEHRVIKQKKRVEPEYINVCITLAIINEKIRTNVTNSKDGSKNSKQMLLYTFECCHNIIHYTKALRKGIQ